MTSLPNFLIVGAQKAGSSWLAERLGSHPDVYVLPREGNFFNTREPRPIEEYETMFSKRSGQTAAGESTPGYMFRGECPQRIRDAYEFLDVIVRSGQVPSKNEGQLALLNAAISF